MKPESEGGVMKSLKGVRASAYVRMRLMA